MLKLIDNEILLSLRHECDKLEHLVFRESIQVRRFRQRMVDDAVELPDTFVNDIEASPLLMDKQSCESVFPDQRLQPADIACINRLFPDDA